MTLQTLILRYAAFAVVATIANLAIQRFVRQFGETGVHFAGAVGAGTIVGLVIKESLKNLPRSMGIVAERRAEA